MHPSSLSGAESGPLAALPVGVLRLHFEGPAPGPPATVWRSVLGRALRGSVCITDQASCTGCLLRRTCAYPRLFEPDTPSREPPFGTSPPPPTPYSLCSEAAPGATHLQLRLFGGWAVGMTPLLLAVLSRAGKRGLGRERRCYVLTGVESLAATGHWQPWDSAELPNGLPTAPPCPARTEIILVSPLRLQRAGRILSAQEITARDFGLALLRRIQLLCWAHSEDTAPTPPLNALDELRLLRTDLHRQPGTRYSAHQRRNVPLDGPVGCLEFGGSGLSALWPWLWAGQWTQLGKGATQGLGVYRLQAAPDPASLP